MNASLSDLKFGVTAGGGIGTEYFRKFTVDAATPTVGQALGEVISSFNLPTDVSDLKAMKAGDISTVSGNGSLKVSAKPA